MIQNTETTENNILLEAVLQGRLDYIRSCALSGALLGGIFQDRHHNAYYSFGVDFVTCNGVIEKCDDRVLADEEIDQAISFFKERKLPFMWWTSANTLENKGFQFGGTLTGVTLDISKGISDKIILSQQPTIKIAQSEADMEAFADLAGSMFVNESSIKQFQTVNTTAMKRGEQLYFLAYIDNTLVGTAALSLCAPYAGVWNLATLPEYRKSGIGTSLVQATLVEARKRQYDKVIAILMPKGMAWGIFKKLGFKDVCQFPFYVYGISKDEIEK